MKDKKLVAKIYETTVDVTCLKLSNGKICTCKYTPYYGSPKLCSKFKNQFCVDRPYLGVIICLPYKMVLEKYEEERARAKLLKRPIKRPISRFAHTWVSDMIFVVHGDEAYGYYKSSINPVQYIPRLRKKGMNIEKEKCNHERH
jgi:hypothetical protein